MVQELTTISAVFLPCAFFPALPCWIGFYLNGNDGDDLDLDPVELVETSPAPGLHQPREYPANRLVVLTVGAVDHHHVLGKVLPQVLRRCASW